MKKKENIVTYQMIEEICSLTIAEDAMEAWLTLGEPEKGFDYQEEILLQYLQDEEVTQGIIEEALKKAVAEKTYQRPFLVAEGKAAENGKGGYYEYFFDTDLQTKPVEKEDGTVDYLNMKLFEEAVEEQLLACYHPATKGENGFTVKNQTLKALDGKNLPPLKGSGFVYDRESQEYRARIAGRIVFKNNTLKIDPLLIVDEVCYSTGNIRFNGDVLVKDCVRTGMLVEATGDIMVNGNVEGATLICDGNVLIKRGATADYKGTIKAGGNVSGRFFEEAVVEAGDSIFSDYFLNCDLYAKKNITATGRKGSLAGGMSRCHQEIRVVQLGNKAGLKTVVSMFYENPARKKEAYLSKVYALEEERNALLNEREQLEDSLEGDALENSVKYNKLGYDIKRQEEKIAEARENFQKLLEDLKKNSVNVAVSGIAHEGCQITFGKAEKVLKEAQREIRFRREGKDVVAESL